MTELLVRRLQIDLQTPFPGRWNGGDAFRSALFNALSMAFPVGEQYFIDSLRNGLAALPEQQRQQFAAEVQGFVGQEATHRHLHGLFNRNLEKLGYRNLIAQRARHRISKNAAIDLRLHLAATAATEHLTAIFADWLLRHPEALEGAPERLRLLWQWHSAEETEHRNTAFDLHQAAGGSYQWRVRCFRFVTAIFLWDLLCQLILNLWHDRSLFNWSSWRNAARLLFAPDGLIRGNFGKWRDYLQPEFHPSQHEGGRAAQWLTDNEAQFLVLGEGR